MSSVSPDPDPRDTFARDQREAAEEVQTRDEVQWYIHCREADTIDAVRWTEIGRMQAWTRVVQGIAGLLSAALLILLVWAAYTAFQVIA